MKLNLLTENFYRGVGQGSDSRYITWVTPNYDLADGYAYQRNGKVTKININPKKVLDLGKDTQFVSIIHIISKAVKNRGSISNSKGKELVRTVKDYYGDDRGELHTFWSSENDKKTLNYFLKSLGYDSIRVIEKGVETYGILS